MPEETATAEETTSQETAENSVDTTDAKEETVTAEETTNPTEAVEETKETVTEEAVSEKTVSNDETSSQEQSPQSGTGQEDRHAPYDKEKMHRIPKFKKKVCKFCNDSKVTINYKDKNMLEDFITDRGKILPRRVTGTCAKHQRDVAREIKRARAIAIIPFVEQ
jgi:small subunit ribosomal protein S18